MKNAEHVASAFLYCWIFYVVLSLCRGRSLNLIFVGVVFTKIRHQKIDVKRVVADLLIFFIVLGYEFILGRFIGFIEIYYICYDYKEVKNPVTNQS